VGEDFLDFDATGQADLVRRRKVTPLELIDAAIARIERLNPVLNAVTIPLFEKAREHAVSASLPDGPFRGVPMLLKDYFCYTANDPYYEGTRFLQANDWREDHDSYLATTFRAAGFIFLGKTNLPEMALGVDPGAEGLWGRTNNPWDRARSPGGSSSGSCAAVAAGMVAVAHANDGTGSIRLPASACGLVGLKPSRGRVSAGPGRLPGILGNVSEHVVTRTVRDTAAVLDAVSGSMPGDLFAAPHPVRPYREEVGRPPGRLRVGLLAEDIFLQAPVHAECVAAVEETGRLLTELGHEVEVAHPAALEGSTGLGEALGVVSASGLAARLEAWSERLGRTIGREDVSPAVWETAENGRSYSAVKLQWSVSRLAAGVMRVRDWWASGFDLLVTPTVQQPPPLWEDATRKKAAGNWGLFTMPWSISGQPAISLPLHWTPEGLPVGVQLVADSGREDVLIRVASQLEEAKPWSARRPAVWL
jgi:amidase